MRIAMSFAAVLTLVPAARAQVITRVSVDANGNEGNSASGGWQTYGQRTVALSADGNIVAFTSGATNLVTGDTNGFIDIFVVDRVAGTIERVSVESNGMEADDDCYAPTISANGQVVGFWSNATTLVPNDTNGFADSFIHDRVTGVTERVSVDTTGAQGDSGSYRVSLSWDGSLAAFESDATNLIASDLNHSTDIFMRDRVAGTTRRVSLTNTGGGANRGGCFDPDMSADGRYVVFDSRASNLVDGDTNGTGDVFVRDTVAKTTTRVSVDSNGGESSGGSVTHCISADGSTIAFMSTASNLVAGDDNHQADIFVHELASGVTERVSLDSSGAQADRNSDNPRLSADGKFVVFESNATDLVVNDTNLATDIFLHDRADGTTAILSVDHSGTPSDDLSIDPAISGDATKVAFASRATILVANDANGESDVFLDDVAAMQTAASWTNYGAGFAGTNGIPAFTPSGNPVIGATITLDATNSSGAWSVALAMIGAQSASIPTRAGGTLLVVPQWNVFIPLAPSGGSLTGATPPNAALFGISLFGQVLELDSGAAYGVSFTPGLQLVFGK